MHDHGSEHQALAALAGSRSQGIKEVGILVAGVVCHVGSNVAQAVGAESCQRLAAGPDLGAGAGGVERGVKPCQALLLPLCQKLCQLGDGEPCIGKGKGEWNGKAR